MKVRYLLIISFLIPCLTGHSQVELNQPVLNFHRIQLPYDRMIQPAGLQIYFGDRSLENHALDLALSPDLKWLAVEERSSIVFISTIDKKVKFILENDTHGDLLNGNNTYSGIIWHTGQNGLEVYWSTVGNGNRSYVVQCNMGWSKSSIRKDD